MSAPRTGLVLGKFLPPHRGHQYLLDFARAYVPDLTVLVCSLANEPIPGELRHRWVSELCPGARVLHVPDENPSEPHEHPDFWTIWIDTIRRRLPMGPEVVFTSERYGEELARRLGAEHVVVDPTRSLLPISGTAVRQDPLAHWEYLPECVRPYFVRRVVVSGPESTGKTTLCQNLARHFGTVWVPEWARGHLDFLGRGPVWEDFPRIVRAQRASEDALARQAYRVLFVDTDALITRLYAELYFGGCPPEVQAACASADYPLTLLCDVDVPWIADAQRDFPEQRREIFERCRRHLDAAGRNTAIIRGTWEERLARAIVAVEEVLR
jgi:NadR type nicotinamide-nucleotide adenylyltransferase